MRDVLLYNKKKIAGMFARVMVLVGCPTTTHAHTGGAEGTGAETAQLYPSPLTKLYLPGNTRSRLHFSPISLSLHFFFSPETLDFRVWRTQDSREDTEVNQEPASPTPGSSLLLACWGGDSPQHY